MLGYSLVQTGAFQGPAWVAVGTAVALLLTLTLVVLRSQRPFGRAALVLAVVVMVLGVVLNPAISYLGSVFFVIGGVMLVGQPEVPLRQSISIAAVLSTALVVRAVVADPTWTVLLTNLFGSVAVLLLGLNRRQRVLRLRETARVTELEQRSRIASDLHDVLAHSLGGLVVQLDAAGAELERGHTDAAAVRVRASRQLAVDGLREARAAVEQLRSGASPELAPAVTGLGDQLRTVLYGPVGLHLGVELEVIGDERPVPTAVADTILAVARESLTNINKHAPGARVAASLTYAPDAVHLDVVNALPAAGDAPCDASDSAVTTQLADTGGGLGLLGLRERAAAVSGLLSAGPEGRRWVTSVHCPTGPGADQPVRPAREVR